MSVIGALSRRRTMNESVLAAPVAIDYPSSDGKPMADSDAQRAAIIYAIDALRTWFADRDDVYVSGDLLIYYREGTWKRGSRRTPSWCSDRAITSG